MDTVHVFVSTGRFTSFEAMRTFVEQTYTVDGEGIPSEFAREVNQSWYEPGCIECNYEDHPLPVIELLAGSSYSEQCLAQLKTSEIADASICVFSPNVIDNPRGTSMKYLGSFNYNP